MKYINKVNIVDEVFKQLEEKISTGQWEPGQQIPSEAELTVMLNVSRNTLRSAIQKLKGMSVIESRQGQGTFVCKNSVDNIIESIIPLKLLSDHEVLELAQFRKTVEMGSVYFAALNRDENDLKKIEIALNKMKECLNDYVQHAKADYMFHVAVAEASKNRYFIRMYKTLKKVIYEHFLKMSHDLGTDISIVAHEEIFAAIVKKDPELAQLITGRSINMSLDLLEERIK